MNNLEDQSFGSAPDKDDDSENNIGEHLVSDKGKNKNLGYLEWEIPDCQY